MKQTALIVGILALGIGAGYLLFSSGVVDVRSSGRTDATEIQTLRRERFEDLERIKELEAEIERLKALLAQASTPEEPYPGDTPEKVERLLSEAYAETNVDWLIEVIDRLLAMGEPGYPLLRKLIMDIAFKAKFRPAQTDFRIDHLYKVGRIFANREKKFIGFINFLLTESGTHPYLKQGAMMAGAFYVGSNAPGTEDLKQTMMQQFLETQGTSGIAGALPGDIGKKMQIFAMAMTGNKEMIGPLRKELEQTQKKRDQADIIKALAYLGDPATVPLVKERLDPTQDNRQLIEALGRVGTEEAHETATNFLRSVTDSKQFYSQARGYVRSGGGDAAVLLIRERIQANPADPEIGRTIGTLRRFPTQNSYDTLNLIATTTPDKQLAERAASAATDVDKRLRGEIPEVNKN